CGNEIACLNWSSDTTTQINISDQKSVVEDGIQWIINPYDEFAIEEAIKLTEQHGGEVTIIALGPARVEKTIREALAMGAHKAIRINTEAIPDDPGVTATALATVLKEGSYDLIFTGRQAIDDDHAQVPSRIAQQLDLPCASVIVSLELDGNNATALREVEGGHERLSFSLPAVIGANRHLNEPRYRSMRGIMQAKRIPIEVVEATLPEAQLVVENLSYPQEKGERKLFNEGAADAAAVVQLLRDEAQVI
ncbi:MAG: electron transfer flavoprotein subunit beta/FixA family protein, partial [Bacteroidota bacterium]